ncbi:TetR/AcrR family transcriptional regulator [Priestia aryabhattai]|uniref:TetR/AcrR family transcriptional regulator n=1 Tax=Priestia aryabhattai TaxID=412384 RepID=UPI001873959E|nr:TetR/AcrR family transcriptional regulator [Priestia aryabhattai]MBE5102264.1 WHG domain-containing protein [Priestia aryabhattai]
MTPRLGLDLDTILQASTKMADTQGLDEVTLASLAKKLNIRPPSLYNHINGLPALRKKLAIYGYEQLHKILTRATVGRSKDNAVRALGEAYVGFVRNHPGLYEAMLRSPDSEDLDLKRVQNETVDIVIQVLNEYHLGEDRTLHATRGLRSILHGFASLEQNKGFGLPLDLDISLRLLIDTFLAGIRTIKEENINSEYVRD